jgi:hypothetical protein
MNMSKLQLIISWLLFVAPIASEAVARPRSDALNGIVAVVGGQVIHTHDIEIGKQRAEFVRHILKDRLKYVRTGRRMADFHSWIRKRGGDVQVLSTHGVDVSFDALPMSEPKVTKFDYDENHNSLQILQKNDPFAMDRLDLDLPVNNLPNLYEGKPIHLMDEVAASFFQLFWRTVQLSIKFSPVLSTTWLALLSTKFRKVWYKWVASSLGELLFRVRDWSSANFFISIEIKSRRAGWECFAHFPVCVMSRINVCRIH